MPPSQKCSSPSTSFWGRKSSSVKRPSPPTPIAAHAIGVSSGSDALLACLMAEDIGPGDEVITTPYTFFATAGAIARLGATPVFVDIDPATYNIDATQIDAKITSRTRAIIPVHLYGQMAEMDEVMRVAETHRSGRHRRRRPGHWRGVQEASRRIHRALRLLFVLPLEKSRWRRGWRHGRHQRCQKRAEKLRCLRSHGSKPKYYHKMVGGNFRLDAIQAAVVCAKLPHLDQWTAARQRNARRYDSAFRGSWSADWASCGRRQTVTSSIST